MKKKSQILVILFLAGFTFQMMSILVGAQQIPRSNSQTTLEYGDFVTIQDTCNDYIEWEFSGNNQYVGLIAFVFDKNNYDIFRVVGDARGYELSNGSYYQDSGVLHVNDNEEWYVIIMNLDSSKQTTTVTYTVNFYNKPNYVAAFILIALVIGIPLIIYLVRRSNRPQVAYYPGYVPQNPPNFNPYTGEITNPIMYCTACGEPNSTKFKYCIKCGKELPIPVKIENIL